MTVTAEGFGRGTPLSRCSEKEEPTPRLTWARGQQTSTPPAMTALPSAALGLHSWLCSQSIFGPIRRQKAGQLWWGGRGPTPGVVGREGTHPWGGGSFAPETSYCITHGEPQATQGLRPSSGDPTPSQARPMFSNTWLVFPFVSHHTERHSPHTRAAGA